MKYLLFNGVVAAALIYLVAGDKLNLSTPETTAETAVEEIAKTASNDAENAYQQTVIETARQVAKVTAERVANEVTERLLSENNDQTAPVATAQSTEELPAVEEEYVEVTPDYVIDEASAVAGNTEPVVADVQTTSNEPAIQLAEGAQLMSPRERQKELDTLAQNMEFLFLSTQ